MKKLFLIIFFICFTPAVQSMETVWAVIEHAKSLLTGYTDPETAEAAARLREPLLTPEEQALWRAYETEATIYRRQQKAKSKLRHIGFSIQTLGLFPKKTLDLSFWEALTIMETKTPKASAHLKTVEKAIVIIEKEGLHLARLSALNSPRRRIPITITLGQIIERLNTQIQATNLS
jgi:hypothetical protein